MCTVGVPPACLSARRPASQQTLTTDCDPHLTDLGMLPPPRMSVSRILAALPAHLPASGPRPPPFPHRSIAVIQASSRRSLYDAEHPLSGSGMPQPGKDSPTSRQAFLGELPVQQRAAEAQARASLCQGRLRPECMAGQLGMCGLRLYNSCRATHAPPPASALWQATAALTSTAFSSIPNAPTAAPTPADAPSAWKVSRVERQGC